MKFKEFFLEVDDQTKWIGGNLPRRTIPQQPPTPPRQQPTPPSQDQETNISSRNIRNLARSPQQSIDDKWRRETAKRFKEVAAQIERNTASIQRGGHINLTELKSIAGELEEVRNKLMQFRSWSRTTDKNMVLIRINQTIEDINSVLLRHSPDTLEKLTQAVKNINAIKLTFLDLDAYED